MVAAKVTNETADFGHLEPMVEATLGELEAAGGTDKPGVVVADAATGTPSRWTRSSTVGSK